ncbi:MAG: epoxyqueuosine reductase [Proteobacteria bacterium]|nr:epoxyqueuosine reductase [Pseudomonadota bacterium]MBU1452942.1 epoxyqueuosine reductase [Pseudomonadota bacterium]MBU2470326.1 epoxyqueuosine reductase [Pseudomonadota bacterium]MBU2516206.1 epoxyqueuosine reductase [Pseudomonadota bacterium]
MEWSQDLREKVDGVLRQEGAAAWGVAGLEGLVPAKLGDFPRAVSLALAMDPKVMTSIRQGPNQTYTDLYEATNQRLNRICARLQQLLAGAGRQAWAVPASVRSDPVNIRGDFPHKTAATRAGLGWVGNNCQLINRRLGPWLRLGTVLTDAPLAPDRPVEKSYCGTCAECVSACPAGALKGGVWRPGLAREEILDPAACDAYKKTHFMHFHQGHICGICSSACPWGQKTLRRVKAQMTPR